MPDEFSSHVIRLGGFHALSCFIASIGKIWASGGLCDILADSGVYASNTVDHMLSGKGFNRAVRGLTVAYECLMVMLLDNFFKWATEENLFADIDECTWQVLLECHSSFAGNEIVNIKATSEVLLLHVVPMLDRFRKLGASSPTFAFWNSFLNAVEIMMMNIRAERDGDWDINCIQLQQ